MAVVESIVVVAGEDSSRDGGEGGLVTLRTVATVATVVGEGFVHSSVHSRDEKVVSVHSAQLLGVGVCDDSPNFSDHNDLMPDSPTDNEVSKYSFYSRLSHYMEGHKISESTRAAVELCILSEAGPFLRNMDPMKKDRTERVFLLGISPLLMKLRKSSSTTKSLSVRVYAKGIRVLRKRILRRVCGGNTNWS